MNSERVSVIMPVYNAERWLERAVESVLAQTHAGLELIVIDDASQDGSPDLLATYAAADTRVKLIRQPANAGVAAARNAGIAAASGSHIAFLDADDWWHLAKLERQLQTMRLSGAKVSYAAYWRVAEDGHVLSKVQPPARVSWQEMLASNHIGMLTGLYARELGDARFQRMGHEDYVFWLELVRRAGHAVCVESSEPLAWYLVRDHSLSANKLRAASWQWAIYRDVAKLGMTESMLYMARYARHALNKRRGADV